PTVRAHTQRRGFTVVGVLLGARVSMLVAAPIPGFDYQIQENLKQFGADPAFISKWDQGFHGGSAPLEERLRKPLTYEDANAIRDGGRSVKSVTAFIQTNWMQAHTVRTKAGEVTAIV